MSALASSVLPTTVEMVADNLHEGVIHGWQSSRLVKYGGDLYACGNVPDPDAKNEWQASGLFWKREPDGRWVEVGALGQRPYTMYVGPDGRFWVVAPTNWDDAPVFRTRLPLDFTSWERLLEGTCAYHGAAISPEGNFLILSTEDAWAADFGVPNAMVGGFFDHGTEEWRRSRIETPEGHYGYVGVILRGRRAFVTMLSALRDAKANPNPPHYSWRHVRLAYCEDLAGGEWADRLWLDPEYGDTFPYDMIQGPDGNVYYCFIANWADSYERAVQTPQRHYVARLEPDLGAEMFPTGLEADATRFILDGHGRWYMVGRPRAGGNLRLWRLAPERGFVPTAEWELPDTAKLQGYVIHLLRPERFGGEDDGGTIHLLTAEYVEATAQRPRYARLWHACFELPR